MLDVQLRDETKRVPQGVPFPELQLQQCQAHLSRPYQYRAQTGVRSNFLLQSQGH